MDDEPAPTAHGDGCGGTARPVYGRPGGPALALVCAACATWVPIEDFADDGPRQ